MPGSYLLGCSFPSAWSGRGEGPWRLYVPGREHLLPAAAARESGTAQHTGLSRSTVPRRLLRVLAPAGAQLRWCSSSLGFS